MRLFKFEHLQLFNRIKAARYDPLLTESAG